MTIQAKALVRLTGIILSLSLFTTIAAKAQAGAGDLGSTGSFDINDKSVKIEKGGNYTIKGKGAETEYTITVNLPSPTDVADITINNVKIGLKGCPFNIKQGVVKLTLEGDNVLKAQGTGSDNTETWCAALQVSEDSELVITKESIGKLTATGGYGGAGIGGGDSSPVGYISIAGGTVAAKGGNGGAGIGGGSNSSAGSITIAGGTVEATGGVRGAGIGGGGNSSRDVSITISGGTVDAKGGSMGSGIGGGSYNTGGSITISGGKVTTKGNIGAGEGSQSPAKGTISGGTIVCKSFTSDLTISGGSVRTDDNSVDKNGKVMTVVKGSPNELPANTKVTSIKIGEVTYNWKDVYTDENGMLYLYLQQDQPGSATVTIGGNEYTANALREYDITNGPITITAAGDYAIVGGETQTGNTITVNLGKKEDVANITIEGVKITTIICPFNIKQGTVNLTLVGDGNVLEAGQQLAALQVSEESKLVITKESTGKLTATGGSNGAGIGGGNKGSVGSITIAGGTVEATGGNQGAGIGGGSGGSAGFISILGGKVTTEGNIGDGEDSLSPAKGEISGGTIVCKSISPTLTISGGSVRTEDNSFVGDKGMAVVKGLPKEKGVTSITIDKQKYGSNDVYTDDKGQLYLYITKDKAVPVSLTIDNQEYTISVTLADLITINGEVSYDKDTHKDKNIRIASNATFTINTLDASVIDLTIEKGGKLLTNKELKVEGRFTVEANTNEQKWLTFCSPVPLKLLNQSWATGLNSSDLFLKSGFTTANDQKWTLEQSIKEDTPYLIGVPIAVTACTLYAQDVTLPGRKEDISINPPSGFDNNLLFCANLSLTEQELTNIYVLEDYNGRQAILLKDNYTLKPFEAYFIASPASSTPLAIESQGEPGKVTSPELRAAPNDIIMPQKLTLKQPNSGKGSFTVKEDKNGQVAYGFALPEKTVTLVLEPKTTDGYSIDNSLIKVYGTNDPNKAITLSGSGNTYTFTMPNAPVTIEVEFMKTLTINPDAGQVVYEDEEITNYHPTYTVEGITEADGNVIFTGNLGVVENKGVFTIDKGDLKAANYTLDVKSDVTVTKLTDKNAADAVAKLDDSPVITNGWYSTNPVTLIAPSGFLIKQTSVSSASLSLRDAADADGYTDKLTFTEQGEHTVVYSLKRKATNKEYGGKSITYKLDYSKPEFEINVYKGKITMTLTDWASGLASYSYSWDGGKEQHADNLTSAPKKLDITLPGGAGTHILSITLKDQAGNKTEVIEREVTVKESYVPDVPDDGEGGNGGSGEPDPDEPVNPDPDEPVANEAIQAPALGISVENGKLCLEASQPCRVMICNYQGGAVMIRQIPSGKTRLYELPAGQYIVRLSAPYLPQGKVVRKVMVW